MALFDDALEGITTRLNTLTANSPFQGNPLAGVGPFTGGMGAVQSPFSGNAFGNSGSPFGSPFGGGGSPFGGNPFGNSGSPFGNPFGSGGSPFGTPQWNVRNPFTWEEEEIDFGQPSGSGSSGGSTGGGGFTPSTLDGTGAQSWLAAQRPDSPLISITPQIVEYAKARGVDPGMLFGVLRAESQFAADNGMGTRQNNPGNIMAPGADPANGKIILRSYGSMLEGVKAMVDLFANYGNTYGATTVEAMIATYYVGPEAYKKYGLQANDAGGSGPGGNGTVQDYLDKKVYPTMQAFGAQRTAPTSVTPGQRNANWEQTAMSFTREGGGWVDYTNGGIRITGNPKDGMDCSSFTGYVLGLDRNIWTAQAQANAAQAKGTRFMDIGQAQKGDLIFFHSTYDTGRGERVTHVGIYLGNGMMIHTGTPGRGVEITSMNTDYWKQHFDGFGRL